MKLSVAALLFCAQAALAQGPANLTGFVWNEVAMRHTQAGHPESALRAQAIVSELKKQKLWTKLRRIPTRSATDSELLRVHTAEYLKRIRSWESGKTTFLEREKFSPYRSSVGLESARTAAGSLLALVEAVTAGQVHNGFALIRPPGHHASADHGMGFCVFNSVAVAAKSLVQTHKRVAIVDIDAHHGNGTESIFAHNPDVLYVSFHEARFWPFTGDVSGDNVLNIPLAYQASDQVYKDEFKTRVLPRVIQFHPDLILVSAGYDGHWRDYMSSLGLSLSGLAWLSQSLVDLAQKTSGGRIVFALEGGYDLEVLANGVANTVKALLGRTDFLDPIGPPPF